MQQGTIQGYIKDFNELILQIYDLSDKKTSYLFKDGLKPRAKQELCQHGFTKFSVAMAKEQSFI